MATVKTQRKAPGLIALFVVLAAAPLLAANDFHFDLMIKICLTAMVAVGLNLLVGYAGQVSLGHAAFYAGGAYASALLTQNYEFTPLPAMFTAAVAVGVLAWLVGLSLIHI